MRWLAAVAAVGLWGCESSGGGVPPLGKYALTAQPVSGSCLILGVPTAQYAFTGALSTRSDAGFVFTITAKDGTVDIFDAGFDGQVASYSRTETAPYGLVDGGTCAPCKMVFTQAGHFALLSPSQNMAAGDMCPANPLTGGVSTDADAGVVLPELGPDGGLDAVRVCGEVNLNVTGEGLNCDPGCYLCTANYRVTGTRL